MSNEDLNLREKLKYYENLSKRDNENIINEINFDEYINSQPDLTLDQMKYIMECEEKFGLIKQFNINLGKEDNNLRDNNKIQFMVKTNNGTLVGYLEPNYFLKSFDKIKKLMNGEIKSLGRSRNKIQKMFKILYYSDMWQMMTKYSYAEKCGNSWKRKYPEMICDKNGNNRFYRISNIGFSYIDIDSRKESVTEEKLHKLIDYLRIKFNYHIEYAVISENGHIGIFIKHYVKNHLEKKQREKELRELSSKINRFCEFIGLESDKIDGFICDPQNKCTFSGKNFFCYKNIYRTNNLKNRVEMILSGEIKNNKESLVKFYNNNKNLFEFDEEQDKEVKKEINIDKFLAEIKFECERMKRNNFKNRFKNENISFEVNEIKEDFNVWDRYNYLMKIGNKLEAYNLLIKNRIKIPEGNRHFMVEVIGLSKFNDYVLKGLDFVSDIPKIADELYFLMDQTGDEHSVKEIEDELMKIYINHKDESISQIERKRKESSDKIKFKNKNVVSNKEDIKEIFDKQRNNANKKNKDEFENKLAIISKIIYNGLINFGYSIYEIKNLFEANLVKDKNKNRNLKHLLNESAEKIYNDNPDEFRVIRGGHYREDINFKSMWNRIKRKIIKLVLKIISNIFKRNIDINKLAEKYCNDDILTLEEIFILRNVYNIQIKNDLMLKSCGSG